MAEPTYGYIRVSRKMFGGEDLFWSEPRLYSKAEAWIDLIALAGWRDRVKMVKDHAVSLKAGQLLASERFLCERWQWSRGKVRRFFELLAKLGRISLETDHEAAHVGAILSITNYSLYQASRTSDGTSFETTDEPLTDQTRTTDGTTDGPKRKTEKKDKEGVKNEEAGGVATPPAPAGAPPDAALLTFRCIRGKKVQATAWNLTLDLLREWEDTYPDMDILAEAKKAKTWVDSHNLKTFDGMRAFLVGWFNRGQNSGRYERRKVDAKVAPSPVDCWSAFIAEQEENPPVGREILREIKLDVRSRMDREEYGTWVAPLRIWEVSGKSVALAVPNDRFMNTLQESFRNQFSATAQELGLDGIEFVSIAAQVAGGLR